MKEAQETEYEMLQNILEELKRIRQRVNYLEKTVAIRKTESSLPAKPDLKGPDFIVDFSNVHHAAKAR